MSQNNIAYFLTSRVFPIDGYDDEHEYNARHEADEFADRQELIERGIIDIHNAEEGYEQ